MDILKPIKLTARLSRPTNTDYGNNAENQLNWFSDLNLLRQVFASTDEFLIARNVVATRLSLVLRLCSKLQWTMSNATLRRLYNCSKFLLLLSSKFLGFFEHQHFLEISLSSLSCKSICTVLRPQHLEIITFHFSVDILCCLRFFFFFYLLFYVPKSLNANWKMTIKCPQTRYSVSHWQFQFSEECLCYFFF